MFLICKNDPGKSFWVGLGLALAIEACISLGADYFAEKRAKGYTMELMDFIKKN